jgi:hypothetical protein
MRLGQKQKELFDAFQNDKIQYKDLDNEALIKLLQGLLDEKSLQGIKESLRAGQLSQIDLCTLVAYFKDFLQKFNQQKSENSGVIITVEGEKLYGLCSINDSLLSGAHDEKRFCWVHDEAWAKERFIEKAPDQKPVGKYLCGQFLGKKKFVGLSTINEKEISKQEALELLGLVGYPAFDKPGNLYLITCQANQAIWDLAQPHVPLFYKLKNQETGKWETASHFGEDTIPGFTQKGTPEVVINTFTVEAKNLNELKAKGVTYLVLN